AVGSGLMGSFEESALLFLVFPAGHLLDDYAQGKSQREITKILNLNPTEARLITDHGSIQTVSVEQLKIGDREQDLNRAQ
ncbi:heavy metal translocating P-type ATPase, partial [Enterococcus faecalis]